MQRRSYRQRRRAILAGPDCRQGKGHACSCSKNTEVKGIWPPMNADQHGSVEISALVMSWLQAPMAGRVWQVLQLWRISR
jgi:hypothetical protein